MSELTPIPAEHRKVYYDALLVGRDEARRRGYHMLDDRIFIEFHRALYRPMVELIVADTRRKLAEEIAEHIDDQLVCCDSYERIEATWDDENGTYDMSEYRAVVSSSDYHARCHYAAFAVRIARKHATTEPPAIARGSGNGDSGQETT